MRTKEEWDKRWKEEFREEFFTSRLVDDLKKCIAPKKVNALMKHMLTRRGKSIYIFGAAGTGKTVLAAMLIDNIKREWYEMPTPKVKNESAWGFFIPVCELLRELRDTFTKVSSLKQNQEEEQLPQQTETEVIDKYSNARYLVLDDLGVEKSSKWTLQSLYIIINRRYENLNSTIITSNFDIDTLAEKLGDDRLPSRIFDMAHLYEMKNEDKRLK